MVTIDSETVSYDLGMSCFLTIQRKNKLFEYAKLEKENSTIHGIKSSSIYFYERETFVKFLTALEDFKKVAIF